MFWFSLVRLCYVELTHPICACPPTRRPPVVLHAYFRFLFCSLPVTCASLVSTITERYGSSLWLIITMSLALWCKDWSNEIATAAYNGHIVLWDMDRCVRTTVDAHWETLRTVLGLGVHGHSASRPCPLARMAHVYLSIWMLIRALCNTDGFVYTCRCVVSAYLKSKSKRRCWRAIPEPSTLFDGTRPRPLRCSPGRKIKT